MAATAPAPLCTTILADGKRCGSPALRGKRFCFHHTGNHRNYTRERRLACRLEGLSSHYDGMNTAEMLLTLHRQLSKLTKTLTRFPEVAHTLTYTLDRLTAITTLESMLMEQLQYNQKFAAYIRGADAESASSPQHRRNQQLRPGIQKHHSNQISNLADATGSTASDPAQPFGSA